MQELSAFTPTMSVWGTASASALGRSVDRENREKAGSVQR